MSETQNNSVIADAFDEFMQSFEDFKETNDNRLNELEKRGATDPITEEKLIRIDKALDLQKHKIDELSYPSPNTNIASEPIGITKLDLDHKSAFDTYLRKGEVSDFASLEGKSLSVGSEADGGYLVPDQIEHEIMQALTTESSIRKISSTLTISTSLYKRPVSVSGAGSGWVGETAVRSETDTPTLAELAFPAMELYAMPAATLTLLDDAVVDVNSWIASEVGQAFAEQESLAFVAGDGINKPKGFLSYGAVPNSSWSWGQLGYTTSGADGEFATDNPADTLIDLIFSLKSAYRKNAQFVLNRLTQSAIRKLKDADGNYLWQPSLGSSLEPKLLGYPVIECEDMPDIASGKFSLAFGDFTRGYLIVDRKGIQVMRDPFSSKPYVLFYTTKRVGGGIQDFNAIKLLKFSVN